jgi:hypothetical protein
MGNVNADTWAAVAAFDAASSLIAAEIIDGEAMILDLRSGRYFSTDGVGAEIWRAASSGVPMGVIVASCRAAFPEHPTVEHDVRALIDSCVDARLLTPVELPREAPMASNESDLSWPGEYAVPSLVPHSQLIDLVKMYDAPLCW